MVAQMAGIQLSSLDIALEEEKTIAKCTHEATLNKMTVSDQ